MEQDCEPIQIHKDWKNYPIRLTDDSSCRQCGKPVFLAQVLDGGLVWRCCSDCSWKEKLPENVFFGGLNLWVSCPKCQRRMGATYLKDNQKSEKGNYGFFCNKCGAGVEFINCYPKNRTILSHGM